MSTVVIYYVLWLTYKKIQNIIFNAKPRKGLIFRLRCYMTKKSIHISQNTEIYITDRTLQGENKNYSAHVNNAFEQLAHLAKAEKPTLSKSEWDELYNVYAGSDLTRLALPFDLANDLQAHYTTLPQGLNELHNKLITMTQAQQFAVIDCIRKYWAIGEDE